MKYFILIAIVCCFLPAHANIRLPALIGDNMVLQRGKPIPVWGYADPAEAVMIRFAGKSYNTAANAQGKWSIKLSALNAGGPYQMVLSGKNTITLSNILMGDVWVCSGQSNMEFLLNQAKNAAQEIKEANYPLIRSFTVNKSIQLNPLNDTHGNWQACNSNTAPYFTAVGYFFARDLQKEIKVPIGIINASWGGTVVESWISKEGLQGEPTFNTKAQKVADFDTAAYNQTHRKLHADWISNFNDQDKGMADGKFAWAANNISLSDWKTINLPTIWGFTGKPDLWEMSGIVWFKKSVTLNKADLQNDAVLNLGAIQNADEAFVNGTAIGRTPDVWGLKRNYKVPAGLLKEGENIITVRIENYGGDGGFVDNATTFNLKTTAGTIGLSGEWRYKIGYTITKFDRPEKEFGPNTAPTLMYNAMINPLVNMRIKGVLWYQGESNWFRGYQYRELFPRMIADWRQKFTQGSFPFLYVQLAGYHRKLNQPEASTYWAELREAQDLATTVKNTGMIPAFDVGDSSNIHPKNKQAVGHRLALLAEKHVYHRLVTADAPHYKSCYVKDNLVILKFTAVANGLKAIPKPAGFQIAGDDHKFYWADARIVDQNTIEVYSSRVLKPVAVRYAWEDYPGDANVYNSGDLPLLPFRTDDWKGFTADNR